MSGAICVVMNNEENIMVDISKIKGNVEGFVGSLKTMINPAGSVPNVNPDDALGMKLAQIATLTKQLTDAQEEQVKNLKQLNQLINGVYQDIEALRVSCKAVKPAEAVETKVEKPVEPVETKTDQ